MKLMWKGLGKKELKSAPDVEFPQLGGQRAVTLAASRQVTGGQPTQIRLQTQNAVFWQVNCGQPHGQLAANR